MPRYYFDCHKGESITIDDEGLELVDLAAAELHARSALGQCIAEPSAGLLEARIAIEVRNDVGAVMSVAATVRTTYYIG